MLRNTPDAYCQTWHLPCDGQLLTYRQFIELACGVCCREVPQSVVPKVALRIAGALQQDGA